MYEQSSKNKRTEETRKIIANLNSELSWHLTSDHLEHYIVNVQLHLPKPIDESDIRRVAIYYHHDHEVVEALQDGTNLRHDSVWAEWIRQVMVIIRHTGLAWSTDLSIDSEDLAQIASAELVRAIPAFHYSSRFSTWAHRVIVQSIHRHMRDRQALKRAANPSSIETTPEIEMPIAEENQPEHEAEASVLYSHVERILSDQPDKRLTLIFRLWAVEDRRVEEIGQAVNLSPSQVRTLLSRIREILRTDPIIYDWIEDKS